MDVCLYFSSVYAFGRMTGIWDEGLFKYLRSCQTVQQSGYSTLFSFRKCVSCSCSTSSPNLAIIILFHFSPLQSHGDLICSSQMTINAEHLFMYLFSIHISFFVKWLFTSVAHVCHIIEFEVLYIFWQQVPFHLYVLPVFSASSWLAFILVMVSFEKQTFLIQIFSLSNLFLLY